jgi:peptidoglycan hydrolase-like amidase
MCQCGAIGRARAGQKHGDILRAYYTGVTLEKEY